MYGSEVVSPRGHYFRTDGLVYNNSPTKISLFIANYSRELRMGVDIKRKGKIEKTIEFLERMKKVQKEVGTTLRKTQKEIK